MTKLPHGRRSSDKSLRVLQTVVRPSSDNNPFVSLMVANMPEYVLTQWFTWKQFLAADYDVLHVQWPEKLVSSDSFVKGAAKRLAFRIAMVRARARRRGVVLTVHNLEAHERSTRAETRALRWFYRYVDEFVVLNQSASLDNITRRSPRVIPHGSYSQRYQPRDPGLVRVGNFAYVGAIRAYKNVPGLMHAFVGAAQQDDRLHLTVAGRPWTEELADEIRGLAAGRTDVHLRLHALDDDELIQVLSGAEMLVLPYVQLYNSGVVFLALTVGVPVLVPRTPATILLQREFGDYWIRIFDAPLSAGALLAARGASAPSDLPDLSRYDWARLSEQYAELYRSLL